MTLSNSTKGRIVAAEVPSIANEKIGAEVTLSNSTKGRIIVAEVPSVANTHKNMTLPQAKSAWDFLFEGV